MPSGLLKRGVLENKPSSLMIFQAGNLHLYRISNFHVWLADSMCFHFFPVVHCELQQSSESCLMLDFIVLKWVGGHKSDGCKPQTYTSLMFVVYIPNFDLDVATLKKDRSRRIVLKWWPSFLSVFGSPSHPMLENLQVKPILQPGGAEEWSHPREQSRATVPVSPGVPGVGWRSKVHAETTARRPLVV